MPRFLQRILAPGFLALLAGLALGEWPQWRGPDRSGVALKSPALADTWSDEGPAKLWTSEELPENSGEGSVAAVGERAYLFVNWARLVPTPVRKIDRQVLNKLRWIDQERIPAALLKKVEEARLNKAPKSRRLVKKWSKEWSEANLGDEDKRWQGQLERRLGEGKDALSLQTLAKLGAARDRSFPTATEFEKWLATQGFNEDEQKAVIEAVPTTKPLAEDVVLCLGLNDGKTIWKRQLPGIADRGMASSTPTIVDDRLYVTGTTHVHCLDATSGVPIWKSALPSDTSASSLLVTEDHVIGLCGRLVAWHRSSGDIAWTQKSIRGRKSSPVLWTHKGQSYVLVNTGLGTITCVRLKDGELLWTAPGGGDSTPVITGDVALVHSEEEKLGLIAYDLTPEAAKKRWHIALQGRGAASPLVYKGNVYLVGSDRILCARLSDGHEHWNKKATADITSPFIADGKLFTLINKGSDFVALDASPGEFRELAKTRVRAQRCPSPTFANGRVLLRHRDAVICYDLKRTP